MPEPREIEEKFWKALKSDRTVMLALEGFEDGASRPMTVQCEGDDGDGPLWMFTSRETELAHALVGRGRAMIHFADKGHDLFSVIEGDLEAVEDQAMIEKLWNPFVAAWFKGGKTDPDILLLRFDPERARVWLNENGLFAAFKLMLGRDPKKDYADKVADLRL